MITYNSTTFEGTASGMSTGTMHTNTTSVYAFNSYREPVLEDTIVYPDKIELIYSEQRMYTTWPPSPDQERYFKIIYSCKDGKWDVSERIYGKKIPAQDEYYEFED